MRDTVEDNTAVDEEELDGASIKTQLVRRFYQIIGEDKEEQGMSTGANRQNRWMSNTTVRNPGYMPSENPVAGNSANAAEVARTAAKKVSKTKSLMVK